MAGTLLTRTQTGVETTLAAELARSHLPATLILEAHLRERLGRPCPVRLHVTGPDPHPGVRHLTDDEQSRLGIPSLAEWCYWRTGLLLYNLNEIAAVTTLVWLPGMLRVEACLDLASGTVPAGKALPGMQRADRRALALTERERELNPADGLAGDLDIAVTASAVVVVGGWPVAIATERIPRTCTEFLAGQD